MEPGSDGIMRRQSRCSLGSDSQKVCFMTMPAMPTVAYRFLGIDLGWQSQPSGVCCLQWDSDGLRLVALDRVTTAAAALDWVDQQMPAGRLGGIAVDAPTLIPNQTGMRECDRLAHRYFGRYDAGCYPANLGLPFAKQTVGFGLRLGDRGFVHAPQIQPRQPQRFQIEMFPHPATVRLFRLPRILKYKKGRVAERRVALQQFRQCILTHLPQHDPSLLINDLTLPDIPSTGTAMKAIEDQLDSLICAYAAAHWWFWGSDRNQTLGTLETGYIIVPNPDQLPLT